MEEIVISKNLYVFAIWSAGLISGMLVTFLINNFDVFGKKKTESRVSNFNTNWDIEKRLSERDKKTKLLDNRFTELEVRVSELLSRETSNKVEKAYYDNLSNEMNKLIGELQGSVQLLEGGQKTQFEINQQLFDLTNNNTEQMKKSVNSMNDGMLSVKKLITDGLEAINSKKKVENTTFEKAKSTEERMRSILLDSVDKNSVNYLSLMDKKCQFPKEQVITEMYRKLKNHTYSINNTNGVNTIKKPNQIFNLPPNAFEKQYKKAYHRLVLRKHYKKNRNSKVA